ncbi:hypothetical protein ACEPAI_2268 [Sanghuangporus weigelae]
MSSSQQDPRTEQEVENGAPLALPQPSEGDDAVQLDLSQEQINTLKFDKLGPMVVNSDGTLSRITNWDKMIPLERERTMRVLNARNRLRLGEQQQKSTDPSGEAVSLATSGA